MNQMKIIKRNGEEVKFNKEKIVNAISKANKEVKPSLQLSSNIINEIATKIENDCSKKLTTVSVEDIQELVEEYLMKYLAFDIAKKYIKYRYEHELLRKQNSTDKQILSIVDSNNELIKQENSNKNPTINSTQRDYIAGEVSKDISKRYLLPEDVNNAHEEGIIHFHDEDYFLQHISNCCLVNLYDMLMNGTVISDTMIDRPKSFSTACNIATQIMAQVASSQYGGQSMSLAHLVPFVDISRQEIKKSVEEEFTDVIIDENSRFKSKSEYIDYVVSKRLKKEINKGVQTIQYQVLTLMTTNGQTPFITLFMYLDEVPAGQQRDDLALIIEEVLNQRIKGTKNEKGVYITPSFPKLIYVLDEDNISEDAPYWYLTKLAAKCTSKRMVPDYISAKIQKELKQGNVYTCMGCVDGDELITYKYKDVLYVETFLNAWSRLSIDFKVQSLNEGTDDYTYMNLEGVSIYDTYKGFVNTERMIKNRWTKWKKVYLGCSREILCTDNHPFETENRGVVLAKDLQPSDIISVNYSQITETDNEKIIKNFYDDMYNAGMKSFRDINNIPNQVFSTSKEDRLKYSAGIIESNDTGVVNFHRNTISMKVNGKKYALKLVALFQSVGMPTKINSINKTKYNDINEYYLFINPCYDLLKYFKNKINIANVEPICNTNRQYNLSTDISYIDDVPVMEVRDVERDAYSYDVTTESGHFEVSGIYSHNCRSFLTVEDNVRNEDGSHKFYGRFNQGVVTINLVDVALTAKTQTENPNIEEAFWKIYDERLELCHKALRARHERLLGTKSDNAPIFWQYGAISRLKKGETIDKLLYGGYSTLSLGYAGLYECVKAMTGKSHTDPKATDFALAVMQKLNDKCAEWRNAENIAYSVYGTPLESTTYKFAKCLRKRFGVIEGITDKNYITNSYHIKVTEPIDAFSKLTFESKFQKLSPGGAISYVEAPNMENNIEAVLELLKHIYNTIMYAEINIKSDYCHECGYTGEIQIVEDENGKLVWECPNCKNRDQSKMNVARRTCGYIGNHFWNQGRTQEIKERYVHCDNHEIDLEK